VEVTPAAIARKIGSRARPQESRKKQATLAEPEHRMGQCESRRDGQSEHHGCAEVSIHSGPLRFHDCRW